MANDVVLFHNAQWQCLFFTSLEEMWRTNILCDAIVVSKQGTEHKVHSIVLAAASSVFRDRLTEKQLQFRVLMTDKDDYLWSMVLQFLYTGFLHVPLKYQLDFQALCDEYCIEPLLGARILKLQPTDNSFALFRQSNYNSVMSCYKDYLSVIDSYDRDIQNQSVLKNEICKNPIESLVEKQMDGSKHLTDISSQYQASNSIQLANKNSTSVTEIIDCSYVKAEIHGDINAEHHDSRPQETHYDSDVTCKEIGINPRTQLWKRPTCGSASGAKRKALLLQSITSSVTTLKQQGKEHSELKPIVQQDATCTDNADNQTCDQPSHNDVMSSSSFASLPEEFKDVARCPKCNGLFKMASFRRHKYWCKGIDRTKTTLQQHVKAYCGECGQAFMSKKGLKFHLLWHKGEKPAKCSVCSATFRQAGYLKEHMRSHTGERPEVCSICQKGFFNKSALKRHSLIHTRSDPYECDRCSATFAQRRGLQCHITTAHTSQKVHQCAVCGSTFCSRGSLRKHTRKKHPGSTLPSMVGLDGQSSRAEDSSPSEGNGIVDNNGLCADEDDEEEDDNDLSQNSSPGVLHEGQGNENDRGEPSRNVHKSNSENESH